jgi:hypothetical protein
MVGGETRLIIHWIIVEWIPIQQGSSIPSVQCIVAAMLDRDSELIPRYIRRGMRENWKLSFIPTVKIPRSMQRGIFNL